MTMFCPIRICGLPSPNYTSFCMTCCSLLQVTRSKVGRARMQQYLRNVQGVPLLIVTGAKDRCVVAAGSTLLGFGLPTALSMPHGHLDLFYADKPECLQDHHTATCCSHLQ